MKQYDLGDVARVTATFTRAGVLSTPSAITVVFVDPVTTTTTKTLAGGGVALESTGVYYSEIALSVAGVWKWHIVSTGAVGAEQGSFLVRPSNIA